MEYDLLIYISNNFMLRCDKTEHKEWRNPMSKCAVSSLNGFPEIEVKNAFNNKYSFTPNDYFIFPTHKNTTSPINSYFGLYEVTK